MASEVVGLVVLHNRSLDFFQYFACYLCLILLYKLVQSFCRICILCIYSNYLFGKYYNNKILWFSKLSKFALMYFYFHYLRTLMHHDLMKIRGLLNASDRLTSVLDDYKFNVLKSRALKKRRTSKVRKAANRCHLLNLLSRESLMRRIELCQSSMIVL